MNTKDCLISQMLLRFSEVVDRGAALSSKEMVIRIEIEEIDEELRSCWISIYIYRERMHAWW